jgi:L-seryl-tRNA(Ser) seleniumtransferase
MRADKAILAAVAATLAIYRSGRAVLDIPVWQLIAREPAALRDRAEWIRSIAAATLGRDDVTVVALDSPVGGGSLPGQTLPSFGVSGPAASPTRAAAALRRGPDRILPRIVDDAIVFDLRTVAPFEDGTIARRIRDVPPPRR